MVRIVERKVRERARKLYDERGQQEGYALKDWFQAETEVLENSIVEPLYRRLKGADRVEIDRAEDAKPEPDPASEETACQSPA